MRGSVKLFLRVRVKALSCEPFDDALNGVIPQVAVAVCAHGIDFRSDDTVPDGIAPGLSHVARVGNAFRMGVSGYG